MLKTCEFSKMSIGGESFTLEFSARFQADLDLPSVPLSSKWMDRDFFRKRSFFLFREGTREPKKRAYFPSYLRFTICPGSESSLFPLVLISVSVVSK